LENKSLNALLTKYTGQLIEKILLGKITAEICLETLNSIRNIIQNGPTWVSIDETVDLLEN